MRKYINFNNGVFDLEIQELLPHQPGYRLTSCLSYDYHSIVTQVDKSVIELLEKHCPKFYQWAMSVMRNETIKVEKLLATINGVVSRQFIINQMFLHLIGKPASGKGTFVRLLQKTVGQGNYQATTLKALNGQFGTSTVIDKQLVICPDEDRHMGDYGTLKALIGGDTVYCEKKYHDPFNAKFDGTLIIVSNNPIFAGDTSGLDRRTSLVEFAHSIPAHKRDDQIEARLEQEIGYLVAIALSMPKERVIKLIKGISEGHIPDFEAMKWQAKCESSSMASWADDCLVYEPGASTPIGNKNSLKECLYPSYLEYCHNHNFTPISTQKFSSELENSLNELGLNVKRKRDRYGVKFHGIRFRTKSDLNPSLISSTRNETEKKENYFPVTKVNYQADNNPTLMKMKLANKKDGRMKIKLWS